MRFHEFRCRSFASHIRLRYVFGEARAREMFHSNSPGAISNVYLVVHRVLITCACDFGCKAILLQCLFYRRLISEQRLRIETVAWFSVAHLRGTFVSMQQPLRRAAVNQSCRAAVFIQHFAAFACVEVQVLDLMCFWRRGRHSNDAF